jgi:hypothetical protein
MSRENVEVVRSMWEALLGDDPVRGLSFCDPDIEWEGRTSPMGDAGGDQVVLVFRETGRSESGLRMDERHAELYTVRKRKSRPSERLLRSSRGHRSRRRVGTRRTQRRLLIRSYLNATNHRALHRLLVPERPFPFANVGVRP